MAAYEPAARAYAAAPPETKVREARSTITISSGVLAPVPSLAGWYSMRSWVAEAIMRRYP
jgi:hypothetical protein